MGCKQEDDDDDDDTGAIVEGTVLTGWENPKGVIRIPDGVTVIGNYALSEETEITGVIIPSSVLTIKEDAFSKCTSLGSVTFEGNGLRTIEKWAFNRCTSLTSITIPDSVTAIEGGAFSNCENLTSVSATGEWEEAYYNVSGTKLVGQLTADVLKAGSVIIYFRRVTE